MEGVKCLHETALGLKVNSGCTLVNSVALFNNDYMKFVEETH